MENAKEKKGKEVRVKFGITGLDLRMKNYEATDVESVCKSLSGRLVIFLVLIFVIMTIVLSLLS